MKRNMLIIGSVFFLIFVIILDIKERNDFLENELHQEYKKTLGDDDLIAGSPYVVYFGSKGIGNYSFSLMAENDIENITLIGQNGKKSTTKSRKKYFEKHKKPLNVIERGDKYVTVILSQDSYVKFFLTKTKTK